MKKLAIYCDCDSDSGMLTYTLMLLQALKMNSDIQVLVISSEARNEKEESRLGKLKSASSELVVLSRNYTKSIDAARKMCEAIVAFGANFYIPNYRYMPHLVLSLLPRTIKNIIVVHSDDDSIYSCIRFYKSAIDGVIFPSRSSFAKADSVIPSSLEKFCVPHYFSALGEPLTSSTLGNKIKIVYHGRLSHEVKKSLELLNIAKHLNNLKVPFLLRIIGSGNALDSIKKIISEESISNVEITGQVSRDELYDLLKDSDIALCTSIYEGFCYSVAESLSLGVVPVVYENDVLHDLIENGKNGYLLPWGRADLVAQKIQELYNNPQTLLEMSNAGVESVQSLLSAKRYADQMVCFFDLIEQSPPGKPWPLFRPRGLPYDTVFSRVVAKLGRKLNLW